MLGRALAMVGRVDDGLAYVEKARDDRDRRRHRSGRRAAVASPHSRGAVGVQIGDRPRLRAPRRPPDLDARARSAGHDREVALAIARPGGAACGEGDLEVLRARSPRPIPTSGLTAAPPSGSAVGSPRAGRRNVVALAAGVVATATCHVPGPGARRLAVALDAATAGRPEDAARALTAPPGARSPRSDRLSTAVVLLAAESSRPAWASGSAAGPGACPHRRLDAMGIRGRRGGAAVRPGRRRPPSADPPSFWPGRDEDADRGRRPRGHDRGGGRRADDYFVGWGV